MIAVIELKGKRTGITSEIKMPVESKVQAGVLVLLLRKKTKFKVTLIRLECQS